MYVRSEGQITKLQNSKTGSYRVNMKLHIIFVLGFAQLFLKNHGWSGDPRPAVGLAVQQQD